MGLRVTHRASEGCKLGLGGTRTTDWCYLSWVGNHIALRELPSIKRSIWEIRWAEKVITLLVSWPVYYIPQLCHNPQLHLVAISAISSANRLI